MNERLDSPEPTESVYNVGQSGDSQSASFSAIHCSDTLDENQDSDGEVIDTDPYIEEPETDPDER